MPFPRPARPAPLTLLVALAAAALATAATAIAADDKKAAASAPAAKAALTVSTVVPQTLVVPMRLAANGNIAAWQEAIVGTEVNGLRLAEVRAGVGDVVKKGQVLAVFAPDTVQADLAQSRASVAEAEARLAEAAANAARARELSATGALSAQQINQYLTAETTAKARLEAARAAAATQQIRLKQTQVLAPDAGVISARSATVGAVMPAGTEMFRLIRQGRLEWRAEVPATDLQRIRPGLPVTVTTPGGAAVSGKVRIVSPVVDDRTRNGIVYVDLVAAPEAKAGMFARGEFDVGASQALTLPQTAVQLREGFSYVMRVNPDSRVSEVKVQTGRRVGDRIEIVKGVEPGMRVVASGGAFLSDGDTVRVVDPATPRGGAGGAPAGAQR